MVSFGIYFYQYNNNQDFDFKTKLIGKDITAGGNKALLTLADGRKVELRTDQTGIIIGKGNVMYNDSTLINQPAHISGQSVQSDEDYEQFSITTPRRGQYQIKLPDGTKVWLNAASSISYSTVLIDGLVCRKVNLIGEAYFEVEKKHELKVVKGKSITRRIPFIVSSNGQEVEVLGTHFNVNAYGDEASIKTTLLEGSVRVSKTNATASIILKPNQQSITAGNNNKLEVRNVNPAAVLSWKNGEFSFENETLESIMRQVSRWYDVKVEYEDESLKAEVFGGSISRFSDVSTVLKMLELTRHIHFIINEKERRIIVMK